MQGGDGDQAGGQDEGGPEEGSSHQLEEDRQDHHQILEVPAGQLLDKYVLIVRKRDISGDDLRREFWIHEEANSPKKKKKEGRGYDVKLDQPKVDHYSSFGC